MKLMALALLFSLATCAAPENRYLTLDEDSQMRDQCQEWEPYGGCVVLPYPMLQHLLSKIQPSRGA